MNLKRFIITGFVAGFADWLAGWAFYGGILEQFYPMQEGAPMNMLFITLGCFSFGFVVSFIWEKWASIHDFKNGILGGLMLGFLLALYSHFFQMSSSIDINWGKSIFMIILDTLIAATVGGVAGWMRGMQMKN